jgi:GNAT superfamily N-acetyltransferase
MLPLTTIKTQKAKTEPMPTHKAPTIRRAKPSDREPLVEMRLLLQNHMEARSPIIWRYTDEGRRETGAQLDEFTENPNSITLVAEEDEHPIGYVDGLISRRTNLLPPTVGYIGTIYVREPHRKQGVGTRLVKELSNHFRREGVDQVNLRYVKGNTEAEEFWKSLGFKPVITTALTSLEELENRLRQRQGETI